MAFVDSFKRALTLGLLCTLAACKPSHTGRSGSAPGKIPPTKAELARAALDVKKQEYIWAIEHTAFELEKKFGAAFLAALKNRDVPALTDFCRPDFAGTGCEPEQRVTLVRGSIEQHESTNHPRSGERSHSLNTSEFMAYLAKYLDEFKEIRNLKFRVLDLHADERRPESGDWTATIYLTAVGQDSKGAAIECISQHRLRLHFLNDEEITAGKIISGWLVLSEKFRRSHGPLFEEATAQAGLDKSGIQDNWTIPHNNVRQYFSQMAVEDFDRDGFLDIAVASADGQWKLFKSLAGEEFRDVGSQLGLPANASEDSRSRSLADQAFLATWVDFDNDGFPDLLLGDRLFRNDRGKRFEDVTDRSELYFEYNPKGCIVADYDGDGLTDLYVLYQSARDGESSGTVGWVGDNHSGAENQLWKNRGHGRFQNVTQEAGAGGGARQSFAASWLYVNDDHFPDLYIANDFGNNVLLINQGDGRFRDVSTNAGVSNYANSMGVVTGDLTGDGRPEIYVANMFSKMGRRIIAHVDPSDYPPGVYDQIRGSCAGNRLFTPDPIANGKSPSYRDMSEDAGVNQVGWAYAPALADFDLDGQLDIYATAGFLSFRRDKPDG